MSPTPLSRVLTPLLGSLLLAAATARAPAPRVPGAVKTALNQPIQKFEFLLPFIMSRAPRVCRNGRFGAPRRYGPHGGLDFAVPRGTPVYSSRAGKVLRAHRFNVLTDWGRGYGGLVVVEHADGSCTWYGHLDRVDVRAGEKVSAFTRLGLTGGENNGDSQGPHLHFMIVRKDGTPFDPSNALGGRRKSL